MKRETLGAELNRQSRASRRGGKSEFLDTEQGSRGVDAAEVRAYSIALPWRGGKGIGYDHLKRRQKLVSEEKVGGGGGGGGVLGSRAWGKGVFFLKEGRKKEKVERREGLSS